MAGNQARSGVSTEHYPCCIRESLTALEGSWFALARTLHKCLMTSTAPLLCHITALWPSDAMCANAYSTTAPPGPLQPQISPPPQLCRLQSITLWGSYSLKPGSLGTVSLRLPRLLEAWWHMPFQCIVLLPGCVYLFSRSLVTGQLCCFLAWLSGTQMMCTPMLRLHGHDPSGPMDNYTGALTECLGRLEFSSLPSCLPRLLCHSASWSAMQGSSFAP